MKTYENNMADQALVVKSLKVLESIDGGAIREIRQGVEAVQKNAIAMVKQQDEYWKDLSADGVISAVEKQSLKREMENIRQSYSAVTQQAASFGYTNPILQVYVRTYGALRSYLYDTLKLFDNMSEDTPIEDREYFNTLFSNYFFLESFILLAITKGVLDTLQFRVLESLNEPGEEGDTGLYHGGLYQYTDGRWKSVTTGAYKGARDELPGEEEDAFFLVSETFVMTDTLIVNNTELLVNGDILGITHSYFKGYIYYCQNGIWNIEEDKTNWRYAAAFADVINVTGELPQIFQDSIDDLQQQIDAQYGILHGDIVEVSEELNGKIARYLGAKNTVPVNPEEGDFFTWNGGNADPWYKGTVYVRRNGAWDALDPKETANRSYYMMALADVLACNIVGDDYFATIFATAIFANDATLQSLSTRTIYLRRGGYIQSDNSQYVPNKLGLNIDYAGNIDANGKTHLGGKVAIGIAGDNPDLNNYDVVIGGNSLIKNNVKIQGQLDGASGTFSGDVNISPYTESNYTYYKFEADTWGPRLRKQSLISGVVNRGQSIDAITTHALRLYNTRPDVYYVGGRESFAKFINEWKEILQNVKTGTDLNLNINIYISAKGLLKIDQVRGDENPLQLNILYIEFITQGQQILSDIGAFIAADQTGLYRLFVNKNAEVYEDQVLYKYNLMSGEPRFSWTSYRNLGDIFSFDASFTLDV